MGVTKPGNLRTVDGREIDFEAAEGFAKRIASVLADLGYVAPEDVGRRMITVRRVAALMNELGGALAFTPPPDNSVKALDDRTTSERAQDDELDVDLEVIKLARKVGALWREQYGDRMSKLGETGRETEWRALLEPLAAMTNPKYTRGEAIEIFVDELREPIRQNPPQPARRSWHQGRYVEARGARHVVERMMFGQWRCVDSLDDASVRKVT
ncbi:MAG: hypothetical protein JWM74_5011 [Myxococcaceae bacterium]|nr:hypothetical protein [Myxococcaceae bacterium]